MFIIYLFFVISLIYIIYNMKTARYWYHNDTKDCKISQDNLEKEGYTEISKLVFDVISK